jgi:hypothetical protein
MRTPVVRGPTAMLTSWRGAWPGSGAALSELTGVEECRRDVEGTG